MIITPEERSKRTVKIITQNRKARHEYMIVSTLEAGIMLQGTEVKSLRAGKCNLSDSYADFPSKSHNELYLLHCHISPYDFGNRENHDPMRPKKLLIKDNEAIKLRAAIQEKGMTVVPLSLYFSGPFVKVELAMAKGKKLHDKRADIKDRDIQREMRRRSNDN
ncbi:MAG: SsrA-binding protein SmpB [Ignavibacteria bacterium]|nr:SsrA-binding protein SmpB [Ignavibacteria bacterium]